MTSNMGTTPQTATINTAFGTLLAVTVLDANSNPVQGVPVTFTAPAGGASGTFANSTNMTTAMTGSNGVATATTFTANTVAGGPYTVTAAATGLTTVNFSLTNTAGTASTMTPNAGTTPQSATVYMAFGTSLAVTVVDGFSNPVPGVSVTFTAPATGVTGLFANSTNMTTAMTGSNGVATATAFTANGTAGGPYNVVASAGGVSNVNFALTNIAAPVMVPNVFDDTQSTATSAIMGADLMVGVVTQQTSTTVPLGDVISESPVAGTTVYTGSSVNLVVSSGPPNGEWTWVNGAKFANQKGTYGTLGTAAPGNVPGARELAVTWTDLAGNFWLFGGYGYDSLGSQGSLNDLWEYSAGQWTWMSGSDVVNQSGTYGTLGTPAAGNVPGARNGAVGWTDTAGSLWLFGGISYGRFNDLWKYSGGQWTWMGGSDVANQPGTYGTLGMPAPGNVPGARNLSAVWTDAAGNFWLFGGYGYDSAGGQEELNDLWEYSGGHWTWMGGANVIDQKGTYGTQGTAAANNAPGARFAAATWTDGAGNFWLFGGFGYGSVGTQAELNDLWKYSGGQWTWIGGSNVVDQPGTYGTQGRAAPNNIPGARNAAVAWTDATGNFWLFGGEGYNGYLNDLWKYSGGQWTWMGGSNVVDQGGIYGSEGTPAADNIPGARFQAASWTDAVGNFWLLGGSGNSGFFNDLWEYQPITVPGNAAQFAVSAPATATAGTAFNFTVTALDANSNTVKGYSGTVHFASSDTAAGVSLPLDMTLTSGTGTFSATLATAGPQTITATDTVTNLITGTSGSITVSAGTASTMTANAGTTPQSATVTAAFGNALAVTVKDANNNPVSGVNVTFTAPGSGASGKFSNSAATIVIATNGSGVASAPFTANTVAGGPYTVTAAATGLTTVNFSLTNTAGTASTMSANAGTTPQSATVTAAFSNALAVTVLDANSNPVSGVNVTFTAPGSGASGKFSNSTATIVIATNGSGVASAAFTANTVAGGPYTVTAAATGLTTVNFSLTNTAGTASTMTPYVGTTPQSATINTAFGNPLAVTVKDANSNPVSGVNVTFTAPTTGASGKFANMTNTTQATTGSNGRATATAFTANTSVGGPYNVVASAPGLTSVNFALTNTSTGPVVTFIGTDTHTQGTWQTSGGKIYGTDGYSVEGDSQSLPGYITQYSTQGGTAYAWVPYPPGTTDPRALLTGSDAGRVAGCLFSDSSFTLNINFTGGSHLFALYALDWDSTSRSETITIRDPNNGNKVLDMETVSNFHNGTYLVWNISGQVVVQVSMTGGANAVISGVFFGVAETVQVTPTNATLSANEQQQFTAAFTGTPGVSWSISNVSPSGAAPGQVDPVTGKYTAPASITQATTLTVNATTQDGTVSGNATVTLTPTSTQVSVPNVVGDTQTVASATLVVGAGLTVGTVTMSSSPTVPLGEVISESPGAGTLVNTGSAVNLVVSTGSGGSGPTVAFVKADTTTQGNWWGTYGADGYDVINASTSVPNPLVPNPNIPSYATFNVNGGTPYTWAPTTSDPRALEDSTSGPTGPRIAATLYNPSTFSFDLNISGGVAKKFALYAVDWDLQGRSETVKIVDPNNNNAVLDTEDITNSNFAHGQYLVWNISGQVKIIITLDPGAGGNAVVSGVFFGGSSGGSSETVTVKPQQITLAANQQQPFTAVVTGTASQTVTWSVSSGPGGIDPSSGIYTAPATFTTGTQVTVKATSQDGTASGTATVTLIATAGVSFIGTDSSTMGNWQGKYGTDGEMVVNGPQLSPPGSYGTFNGVQNASQYTWLPPNPSDPRALETGAGPTGTRTAATWFGSTFNFDVIFNGPQQFELYALDWDYGGRVETITIVDPNNNNAVLDTRTISNFSGGLYLIWNISGHVKIFVTVDSGPNAVISAAFFN